MYLGLAKEVGESLRHDDAVFQRIAGAGGGLGTVGDHPPLPVERARQVDGKQVEVSRPRNRNVMAGTPKSRVGEYQGGGQITVQEQLLRPIEIGKNDVQQARPLDEARFQVAPLRSRDQERNRVQTPRAVGTQRIAIDIVADAVFPDPLPRYLPAVGQFLRAERGQRGDVPVPVGTKDAGLHAHLVVDARSLAIVGGQ